MKNSDGSFMTLEQANTLLQQALMELGQYAVYQSKTLEYIDQLDAYVKKLQEENNNIDGVTLNEVLDNQDDCKAE